MRTAALVLSLSLCLGVGGCLPRLHAELFAPDYAKGLPTAPGSKHPGEVLLLSDRYLYYAGNEVFTDYSLHVVERVLTDSGRSDAAIKRDFALNAELLEVKGQVIAPDGSVSFLAPDQVFWSKDEGAKAMLRHLAFQLPEAQVGSILDWSIVVRFPQYLPSRAGSLAVKVPTRHYELDVQMSKRLFHAARVYNTQLPFTEDEVGDFRRIRWSIEGLEPMEEEDYAGEENFSVPWWLFRIHSVNWGGQVFPIHNQWSDEFESEAERVDVDTDWVMGLEPSLDVTGCTNPWCKVERAWREVHRLTDHAGTGEFWRSRPLKDVLATRLATGFEQALLFRKLLDSVDVESNTVFVTRRLSAPFDATFPNDGFNEVVVWVGPQPGLAEGRFVDASCGHCQPGQLRDVVDGAMGVRVRAEGHAMRRTKVQAEVVEVRGGDRPRDADECAITLEVDGSGDMQGEQRCSYSGALAWEQGRRVLEKTPRVKDEEALKKRVPAAQLTRWALPVCDKEQGRCTQTLAFKVPGGATRVGDSLLVPLSVLDLNFARTFLPEKRKRSIFLLGDNDWATTVEMRVPEGFVAKELPPAERGEGTGFASSVSAWATPTGAQVERRLTKRQGTWPAVMYAGGRAAVRSYADLRGKTLVFEVRKAAPSAP